MNGGSTGGDFIFSHVEVVGGGVEPHLLRLFLYVTPMLAFHTTALALYVFLYLYVCPNLEQSLFPHLNGILKIN